MKPTAEELRNGWTPEKLAEYFREREQQQQDQAKLFAKKTAKPVEVENFKSFSPHDWKGC